MAILTAIFASSLALSILFTPAVRALAHRYGLTDKPDQRRKLHGQDIPVAGGIAVLLATLTTVTLMLGTGWCPWENEFAQSGLQLAGLAVASILIAGVGIVDDWGRLRGRHKMLGQIVAISILMATGPVIQTVRIASVEL